ncbi:DeoR family transcriptional regulator [Streptomyces sp. enrichment culture]|uniref:DeoR family transcriptional regulator n=1 Tax=Streptomyces sp. enrichment culture TaxID=1795815 RepID=UPI003F573498
MPRAVGPWPCRAERFGVSGMTIRRDPAELDRAGLLDRVPGGAVPRRAPAHGSRSSTMTLDKPGIARAVADLVEPGASVGIDTAPPVPQSPRNSPAGTIRP